MTFTSLPSWYEGGFDDMEYAVKCLLDKYLTGTVPKPSVYAWLPEDWRTALPIVAVGRVPGAIQEKPFLDTGEIQVWAICESRADAWALAELVRTIMLAFSKGTLVNVGTHDVHIVSIQKSEGPQLSMEDERLSERVVPLSFYVTTRRRASLPDYERVLNSM